MRLSFASPNYWGRHVCDCKRVGGTINIRNTASPNPTGLVFAVLTQTLALRSPLLSKGRQKELCCTSYPTLVAASLPFSIRRRLVPSVSSIVTEALSG